MRGISEAVGLDNIFLFGLDDAGAERLRHNQYRPRSIYESDPELRLVLDAIWGGMFSPDDPGRYRPIVDRLLDGGDPFLVLADYRAYCECQDNVSRQFADPDAWARKAILNIARSGRFSSDHAIGQYARDIWKVPAGE